MRGDDKRAEGMFSYVRLEERIAADHPLRAIRALVEEVLSKMSAQLSSLYSHTGRPSIAPEQLLKATLLQAFFTVRSERQLVEQIDYNMLFRWFVGLSMDDAVWDASTFSKNRDRLITTEVAQAFLKTLTGLPQVKALLSSDHFSVDGTMIDAWASMKSFVPKDGSGRPGARAQWRAQLPQREALERDAWLNHRHRREAVPQGQWQRKQALLSRPYPDGEPQRADC